MDGTAAVLLHCHSKVDRWYESAAVIPLAKSELNSSLDCACFNNQASVSTRSHLVHSSENTISLSRDPKLPELSHCVLKMLALIQGPDSFNAPGTLQLWLADQRAGMEKRL
jgi:hypothetical protein